MIPERRRIGIFGGGFDPPHNAHIWIAASAAEYLRLERIVFLPSYSSPPKCGKHKAAFADRVAMLKIALKGAKFGFEISDIEFRCAGMSYAVDSAAEISRHFPNCEIFWIMGADQLSILHKWKDVEKLSSLVKFAVFDRPKTAPTDGENIPSCAEIIRVPFVASKVSSSLLRKSIISEGSIAQNIDEGVAEYIIRKKLYGRTEKPEKNEGAETP